MHLLVNPTESAEKLTLSVIQITEMLGLYQAELARILRMNCSDIGYLVNGKRHLHTGTESWQQAILFVRLYELLYKHFKSDEVAIYHWLRAENEELNGVPLLLIVDDGQLRKIVEYFRNQRHRQKTEKQDSP